MYRVRNSMCSFRWNYFRLEIRCLVKHFCSNTALKTQFLSFLTDIRWLLNRKVLLWLQRNIIYEISTKNWVDQYVSEIVSTTFFVGQIFTPGTPRDMWKNESDRNNYFIAYWRYFCHKITFYKFWTCSSLSSWFFE